jgi:hydrogenase/urease accessory protein HupE
MRVRRAFPPDCQNSSSMDSSMKVSRLLVLAVTALGSSPVIAHTGTGEVISFSSGFAHPFHGLDHVLAMTAVGMWQASWDDGPC